MGGSAEGRQAECLTGIRGVHLLGMGGDSGDHQRGSGIVLGMRLGVGSRGKEQVGRSTEGPPASLTGVVCGLAVPVGVGSWAEATSRGREVKRKVCGMVSRPRHHSHSDLSDQCHVWSMSIDLQVSSSTYTYVALIPILFNALLVHKVNPHCSFWNHNY